MSRPAVYLAGPDVFLPRAAALADAKVRLCAAHGLDGRAPFAAVDALGPLDHLPPPEQGRAFYDALLAMLDACDAVIANMTPFRGPSTDVGTAWEMGYATGKGMPVFAYTNRAEHLGERVDEDGLLIEAFDFADNLMLDASVQASGHPVVRHDSGLAGAAAIEVLDGFESCVRHAAAVLLTPSA